MTDAASPSGLSEAAQALLARRAALNPNAGPRRGSSTGTAPLSSPQLGQWLAGEVSSSALLGAQPKTLHLEGSLDRSALRKALTELVRRHEILRTIFPIRSGEPVQHVLPPFDVALPELDLREQAAPERRRAALDLLDRDARRRFDLTRDIQMRALLVQLDDRAYEFQVTFHPVAFDGWSNGVFLRELGALYSAFAIGR
ncbi:MAG TPA: condensation domain-containing protein, partial [Gemmatimonadales bacterium]|nr:condensation domain-containing protein [Gemmatimonadales bacterium]